MPSRFRARPQRLIGSRCDRWLFEFDGKIPAAFGIDVGNPDGRLEHAPDKKSRVSLPLTERSQVVQPRGAPPRGVESGLQLDDTGCGIGRDGGLGATERDAARVEVFEHNEPLTPSPVDAFEHTTRLVDRQVPPPECEIYDSRLF